MISPTHGRLEIPQVVDKIDEFITTHPGDYKFIVGTDSQAYNGTVLFVTAFVVHRVGKGAVYFYRKNKVSKKYSLADRMFTEACYSMDLASKIVKEINAKGCPFCDDITKLEIHVDVGRNGETRDVINGVVGMVRGSGFKCELKPDAYGASHVADRHTKNKK